MIKRLCAWLFTFSTLACSGSAVDDGVSDARQSLHGQRAPTGLSLFFVNGQAPTLHVDHREARFLQEIDIVESVGTASDEGLEPLIVNSAVSALDWSNVEQVEELWIPSLDGSFTRERYFRNARWMEQPSRFKLVARDAHGHKLGPAWAVKAGRDDRSRPSDDMFVRRFVARQSAFGCASVGDCTGATYLAEALIQLRGALHPERARRIPRGTKRLELWWNLLPGKNLPVDVQHTPLDSFDFGYGFRVQLEPVSPPANGVYYVPGESISLRVSFLDGRGNRLHPEGELPDYASFVAGQVVSGLRYLDLQLRTRLYYALKHRESNLLVVLSGPTNKLSTPKTVVDPSLFFGPQVPFATTAVDGFTAVGQTLPSAGIVFGGLADPTLWSLPVSDVITFTIPPDAEAGTYVAAIKARRDFRGEALNRGTTLEIQVGQAMPTTFTPATACSGCHDGKQTSFSKLLHGLDDRRACFGCHASLGIEFDNALDIRVHAIHSRSDRFDADITDCMLCHLTPPLGPQRGVLP